MTARSIVLACCALSAVILADPLPAAPAEELVVPPGARIELTPPAPGSKVEAALGGGLLAPVDGGLDAPSEGDHWLAVATREADGERSALRWLRLRVDGEAPEIELAIDPPPVADEAGGAPWIAPGSTAVARARDALAGLRTLELAAPPDTLRGPSGALRLPLPARGEVTVRASAEDRVGNRAAGEELALRVDAEPPTGSLELSGPRVERQGRLFAAPALSIRVRADDAGSGVALVEPRVDGEAVAAERFAGPWEPGRYTLDAALEDRVGNRAATAPVTVEIDGEGPRLTHRVRGAGPRPEGVETAGGRVFLPPVRVEVGADDPAGVAALAWSADGGGWSSLPAAGGGFETSAAGAALRADDGVGNRSQTAAGWTLDAAPPRLLLEGAGGEHPGGALVRLSEGGTLRLRAEDEGAGVERAEATLVSVRRWRELPLELTFPTRGRYRLVARARDALGNEGEAAWRIFVDRGEGER